MAYIDSVKTIWVSTEQAGICGCHYVEIRPKMSDVSKSCVCGEPYAISHCLTCKKGGFINIRHNVVRDTTHKLLTEVCRDVRLEPALQPVTGEDLPVGTNITNGARSDVSALGLWAPLTRAFFDIRVFNPLAPSNWSKQNPDMYTHRSWVYRDWTMRCNEH